MKVIYIGTACASGDLEYYASISKKRLVYTQQNWDYSLCQCLQKRCANDLIVFSYPPIDCFPNSKKILLKSRPISNIRYGVVLGTVLIPYVKQSLLAIHLQRAINKVIQKYTGEKIIIITHTIYYQSLKAAFSAKKRYGNVKVISLVPDMPAFLSRTINNNAIIKYYNKATIEAAMNVDGYVCFSEYQMEDLNRDRQHIVLNGFVDPDIIKDEQTKDSIISQVESDKRIKLLYAGKISKSMGIDRLIDAFLSLPNIDACLYLCGNGDIVDSVIKRNDERIVYLGVLPRETVLSIERKCDLLLNPRLIEEEFSKKSFPSKTFEYLVSGVPTLSSHLKCFSSEYDDYMVYFENNSLNEYIEKIKYCIENIEALKEKAILARTFVLEKKNVENYCNDLLNFVGYQNEN